MAHSVFTGPGPPTSQSVTALSLEEDTYTIVPERERPLTHVRLQACMRICRMGRTVWSVPDTAGGLERVGGLTGYRRLTTQVINPKVRRHGQGPCEDEPETRHSE